MRFTVSQKDIMPIITKLEQCFPCNTLVDTAFFRLGGALIQVNTVSLISLWCATVCEGLEHDGTQARNQDFMWGGGGC